MKTLHTAYPARNLERSAGFYERVGFREIGWVAFADGSTPLMRNLPSDGEVVTLERVYDADFPSRGAQRPPDRG